MKTLYLFIIICGLVVGSVWPCSVSAHRPYAPELPIAVKTELIVTDTHHHTQFFRTMIRVTQKTETNFKIGFFPSDQDDAAGMLDFDFLGTISWSGVGQTAPTFHAKNLFIVSGVTLPIDVLPVQMIINAGTPLEYEFTQIAGGRKFFRRIQMTASPVSRDEARQVGWILCDDCFCDAVELQMIVVTDLQTGDLIVKQLWAADGCWWLYEQTPLRRSWRVQ